MVEAIMMHLDLPADLQQLLSDNGLSIVDILREEGIAAEVTYGPPLEDSSASRSKDIAMIILASGGAALAIGIAISLVLQTLQRKPVPVQIDDLVPLTDQAGKAVLDTKGRPRCVRKRVVQLLEPRKVDSQKKLEIGLSPSTGLAIKFGSTDK